MSDSFRNERAAFLGVERSLTGKRWATRLGDERLALAIAQRHGLPDAISRLLAARDVDLDLVADFLEPTLRKFLPDPSHLKDMDAAIARLVRAVADGRAYRRVRRLRRGWCDLLGAAAALLPGRRRQYRRLYSGPPQGGLRPQCAGAAEDQGRGRLRRRHGRLRHHRLRAAGRGQARGPRPHRDRPSHGRDRAARGGGGGRSQPDRRCQSAQASCRRRRRVPAGRRRQPGAARGRLVQRLAARARPSAMARSRGAGHGLRRGPAARRQSRAGEGGPAGDGAAPQCGPRRRWPTSRASRRRRKPTTSASCWARGSMPAAASARPISARACCRATTRTRSARSRSGSTNSTPSAAPSSARCSTRRSRVSRACTAPDRQNLPSVLLVESEGWHVGVIGIVASRLVERYGRPAFVIGMDGGVGQGLGPLGARRRSRRGGDRGAAGRAAGQWRRACDGRRPHRGARFAARTDALPRRADRAPARRRAAGPRTGDRRRARAGGGHRGAGLDDRACRTVRRGQRPAALRPHRRARQLCPAGRARAMSAAPWSAPSAAGSTPSPSGPTRASWGRRFWIPRGPCCMSPERSKSTVSAAAETVRLQIDDAAIGGRLRARLIFGVQVGI